MRPTAAYLAYRPFRSVQFRIESRLIIDASSRLTLCTTSPHFRNIALQINPRIREKKYGETKLLISRTTRIVATVSSVLEQASFSAGARGGLRGKSQEDLRPCSGVFFGALQRHHFL